MMQPSRTLTVVSSHASRMKPLPAYPGIVRVEPREHVNRIGFMQGVIARLHLLQLLLEGIATIGWHAEIDHYWYIV